MILSTQNIGGGVSGTQIGEKLALDVSMISSNAAFDGVTINSYQSKAITGTANTANQSLITAPGAGKQIWVYGISFVVGTGNGSVAFQDEDDTAITPAMALTNGYVFHIPPSGNFDTPLWQVSTNKALEVDTVTCSIAGFITYAIVTV